MFVSALKGWNSYLCRRTRQPIVRQTVLFCRTAKWAAIQQFLFVANMDAATKCARYYLLLICIVLWSETFFTIKLEKVTVQHYSSPFQSSSIDGARIAMKMTLTKFLPVYLLCFKAFHSNSFEHTQHTHVMIKPLRKCFSIKFNTILAKFKTLHTFHMRLHDETDDPTWMIVVFFSGCVNRNKVYSASICISENKCECVEPNHLYSYYIGILHFKCQTIHNTLHMYP